MHLCPFSAPYLVDEEETESGRTQVNRKWNRPCCGKRGVRFRSV